jgi:hypothetical protein
VEDHARSVDAASCGRGRSALPIAGELRGDIQSAVAVCQSASGVADADSVEGGEGHFTNFQSKRLSDEHLAAQGYARGKPLRRKSSARARTKRTSTAALARDAKRACNARPPLLTVQQVEQLLETRPCAPEEMYEPAAF